MVSSVLLTDEVLFVVRRPVPWLFSATDPDLVDVIVMRVEV